MVQVLWSVTEFVPKHRSAEVWSVLTANSSTPSAAERAVNLPQDLLAQWVESLGKVLDLGGAKLPNMQWSMLLMCLAHIPVDAPQTLHVQLLSATEGTQQVETAFSSIRCSTAYPRYRCVARHCNNGRSALPTHFSVGIMFSRCCDNWFAAVDTMCHINAPLCPSLAQLLPSVSGNASSHPVKPHCLLCSRERSQPATHIVFGSPCRTCSKFTPLRITISTASPFQIQVRGGTAAVKLLRCFAPWGVLHITCHCSIWGCTTCICPCQ